MVRAGTDGVLFATGNILEVGLAAALVAGAGVSLSGRCATLKPFDTDLVLNRFEKNILRSKSTIHGASVKPLPVIAEAVCQFL